MSMFQTQYLLTAVLFFTFVSNSLAQEARVTHFERELGYLVEIWPGDYDNQEQVSLDARAYDVDETELPRFHAKVMRLTMPALGDSVFYIEKRNNDDPSNIHSRHVYSAIADDKIRAIRLNAYKVTSKGAEKDVSKLRKRELERLSGCDILLRRDGYSFVGQTEPSQCTELDKRGTHVERYMRISAEQYSFNDRRVSPSGSYVADFKPRTMQRARWFACMIDVPKDTPNLSNHTQHYIKIHDQGGQFLFTHPDGRELVLIMRNTWSYGMQRKTFFIGVFEGSTSGKLLVYSWGQPGSDRIGMNPGYVRIQCDLDTPKNIELQQRLRTES